MHENSKFCGLETSNQVCLPWPNTHTHTHTHTHKYTLPQPAIHSFSLTDSLSHPARQVKF